MKGSRLTMFAIALTLGSAIEIARGDVLGTAFTYQGQLKDEGVPANDEYDFVFRLFDDPVGGAQIGSDFPESDWPVSDGLFTVELDFGTGVFTGDALWLEVSVRLTDVGGEYTDLSPRQPLNATPYALYALSGPGSGGFWAANGDDIYNTNAGNVGIGTTTPQGQLEVLTADEHAIWVTTNYIPVLAYRESTSGTWPAIHGECDSEHAEGSAIRGIMTSSSAGFSSAAVRGINNGTAGGGIGVYGSGGGWGVFGTTPDGTGVQGTSEDGYGVVGFGGGTGGIGVYGWGSGEGALGVFGVGFGEGSYAGYFNGRGYFAGDVGIRVQDPQAALDVGSYSSGQTAIRGVTSGTGVYGLNDSSSGTFPGVWGATDSVSSGATGVRGLVNSAAPGSYSAGVRGHNNGTGGTGIGVYGSQDGNGWGVYGYTPSGRGVYGSSTDGVGVYGYGDIGGYFADSDGSGSASLADGDFGVVAEGNTAGGFFWDANGSGKAWLGYTDPEYESDWGILAYGAFAGGGFTDTTSGTYCRVGHSSYSTDGNGSKDFVQNHPYEKDKVIVYACLEGDEVATYTRGTARLIDGKAIVPLGETFKWVTNPDIGLTAHLTPRGQWAELYVVSLTTEELVVASRDPSSGAAFDYIVYGLRIGFEEASVVQEKEREAYIPSMGDHRALYERRPELREFNALERFERMRVAAGQIGDVDLTASHALRDAVVEFDPAVHELPGGGRPPPDDPVPAAERDDSGSAVSAIKHRTAKGESK